MITDYKITEISCATDEFSKKFDEEIENMPLLGSEGKARRRRAASMMDVSGRHPTDWIRDHVLLNAKTLLRSSDYSVQ